MQDNRLHVKNGEVDGGRRVRRYSILDRAPKVKCIRKKTLLLFTVCVSVALGIACSVWVIAASRNEQEWNQNNDELHLHKVYPNYTLQIENDTLNFLVVGDWGRDGQYGQSNVANAMLKVSKAFKPNFVVSTGDNFYIGGLASVHDRQFDTSFRDMYVGDGLQVPWISVLGNMDYGDFGACGNLENFEDMSCLSKDKINLRSPNHQTGKALRGRDWRWFCDRFFSLSFKQLSIDLIFIDTSPLISRYWTYTWSHTVEGGIAEQNTTAQIQHIERVLKNSDARWKFVIGHHPVYSNGFRGVNSDLKLKIEPILQRYKVNAYLNGHDHDLQHIYPKFGTTHFFTSGAGSKTGRGFGTLDTLYQYDNPGFASFSVTRDAISVQFYDEQGQMLYKYSIQ